MVYMGDLAVVEATYRQMTGRVVNIKLQRVWKERLRTNFGTIAKLHKPIKTIKKNYRKDNQQPR
jgi:hypothetical protein